MWRHIGQANSESGRRTSLSVASTAQLAARFAGYAAAPPPVCQRTGWATPLHGGDVQTTVTPIVRYMGRLFCLHVHQTRTGVALYLPRAGHTALSRLLPARCDGLPFYTHCAWTRRCVMVPHVHGACWWYDYAVLRYWPHATFLPGRDIVRCTMPRHASTACRPAIPQRMVDLTRLYLYC